MKWTSEKPTKPGWYWYMEFGRSYVLRLYEVQLPELATPSKPLYAASGYFGGAVDDMHGQWAGPLEEPQE